VVEAFKAAVTAGLSPVDFWELTPYLTGLAVGSSINRQTIDAWLSANYARAKELPPLADLLVTGKKEPANMADLKDHLMGMKGAG
jgi:hypothetical protein